MNKETLISLILELGRRSGNYNIDAFELCSRINQIEEPKTLEVAQEPLETYTPKHMPGVIIHNGRIKFSNRAEKDILTRYLQGNAPSSIAKLYDVDEHQITYVLGKIAKRATGSGKQAYRRLKTMTRAEAYNGLK